MSKSVTETSVPTGPCVVVVAETEGFSETHEATANTNRRQTADGLGRSYGNHHV